MCFSLVRGWQCSPRKWNQGLWDIGTSLNSLPLFYAMFYKGKGGYRKHCHAHPPAPAAFLLSISLRFHSITPILPASDTHPHSSHSRCWNFLPFLMRVPECLIKVVQPSKSESFTVGRANIYSINKRWVLARGRHCWSLGHRTCHRSTWNCMASDCSCYSQTSHSPWQYAQCFIQCQLKR